MKNYRLALLTMFFLVFTASIVDAQNRAVVEIEVIEGDKTEKRYEIITFDEKRFRIDFVGADKKITQQTSYIMTVDNGDNWVMGDKPKNKFYCSTMQTEEFFRNMGAQVTDAVEFFNVKAESPTVKLVLEEPGPEILGFSTTHVQLETNAKAHAWFLFMKFEYTIKIVDDLWYTTDVDLHPVRKKWNNALAQSGNSLIDQLFADYSSKFAGPILKTESVTDITNIRKNETKTQTERTIATALEELKQDELDEIFKLPQCEQMDDDEVQEKAKALLSAGKLML